ncbi:hypothetical protein [Bifidobacterium dentium]|uniref:hypothetical protein n=3 Tax=Bifidobacterium dentium TaxID=1689 RepID=UPI0026DCFD85|nr:hypothetical protein [Bifidobacterium dentium]
MTTEFGFRLDCAQDDVTPKALRRSVETFLRMLEEADAQDWRISNLGLHSVDLAARPVVDDEESKKSFAALEKVCALATRENIRRSDVEGVEKSIICIWDLIKDLGFPITLVIANRESTFTRETMDRLSPLLDRRDRISFGHVRGVVDKLILQKSHRSIGLVDEVTSQRMEVRFSKNLDTDVQGLSIGMTIDATGLVQRARGRIDAERIRVIANARTEPAGVEELEGILDLDFTGGMGSVEFVSALRDCSRDETMCIGGSP